MIKLSECDFKLSTRNRIIRLCQSGFDGKDWYAIAQSEISSVADSMQCDRKRFADILAITSPRCSVRRNVRNTLQYIQHSEMLANTLQRTETAVKRYETDGIVSGIKVKPFRNALLGDSSALVVDTWIIKAFDCPERFYRRQCVRQYMRKTICSVAKYAGLTIAQCQACIWYGIIRENNGVPIQYPIREEYDRFRSFDYWFPTSGPIPAESDY